VTTERRRTIVYWTLGIIAALGGCLWYSRTNPNAAGPFFTAAAGIAAFVYVVLTYNLWQSSAGQHRAMVTQSETQLMLTLMIEYDQLRESIKQLDKVGVKKLAEFPFEDPPLDEFGGRPQSVAGLMRAYDEPRFRVSRFFVKIRKLSQAGYLRREIIRAALDRDSVQLFLENVDPLDQIVRQLAGKAADTTDRDFYSKLLQEYDL
jgi:hypothetical protein